MPSASVPLIGAYHVTIDDKPEVRVARPDPREVDLRPRSVASSVVKEAPGRRGEFVDVSGYVALALLALVTLEMALRITPARGEART
jgi:hypothetical protein